jgi:endonuclease VIII
MPEGDTVHTLAAILGPWLSGQTIITTRMRGRLLPQLAGCRIIAVGSHGKHLLIDLDGGLCLRSHLGLYGSWHRYRQGEPWQRPPSSASLVLEVGEQVYVCFNAREVELMQGQGLHARDWRNRLGPDLTREASAPEQSWARVMQLLPADTPVTDLLLDQRVVAGIGNIYKSEVLFVTRRSPLLRLDDLTPRDIESLYMTAATLLKQNLAGGPRRTRSGEDGRGRLWVYGRAGRPCLLCATPIRRDRLGRNPRSTYWCPVCQAAE